MKYDIDEVTNYIRDAAESRGINPQTALRVAQAEGLGEGIWQSNVRNRRGLREPSYGPFQMLVGGEGTGFPAGLGNQFMEETGLDPRDPKNVLKTIDYALDTVAKDGWRQWYGARDNGIGRWDGINNAQAQGITAERLEGAGEFIPTTSDEPTQAPPGPSQGQPFSEAPATQIPWQTQENWTNESEEARPSFREMFSASTSIDTIIGQILLDNDHPNIVDPDFTFEESKRLVDKMIEERRNDLPMEPTEQHRRFLLQSGSKKDMIHNFNRLAAEMEAEQQLSSAGVGGFATRLLATALDPVALAGGLAFGRVLQGIEPVRRLHQGTRTQRAAAFGAEAAAANVAIDAFIADRSAVFGPESVLYSGVGGFLLGGSLGAVTARSSTGREMAARMSRAAQSLKDDMERSIAPLEGAGAAQSPLQPQKEAVSIFAEDFRDALFRAEFQEYNVVDTWMHSALPRFDAARQRQSANPLEAAFTSRALADAVGPKDTSAVANVTLDSQTMRVQRHYDTRIARTFDDNYWDYVQRHSDEIGWAEARGPAARTRFNEEVFDAVVDSGSREFDPAVARVAQELRQIMSEFHRMGQGDHREMFGDIRRPLPGWENVPENPRYMPHFYNMKGYDEWRNRIGDDNMRRFWTEAFRRSMDLDQQTAFRLAGSFHSRIGSIAEGTEINFDRAFSGHDRGALARYLREDGFTEEEISDIISRMTQRKSDTEGAARHAKHRMNYDENFHMEFNVGGERVTLRAKDLLIRDASQLASGYVRKMAGQVAMSRLRINNPNHGKVEGADPYIVDGIYTENDWSRFMQKVREVGAAVGQTKEEIDASVERMQWAYDMIMGRPDKFTRQNPKLAQAMRMFRDFTFVRIANQLGFAQVAEMGMITSEFGFRTAVDAMPTARQLFRDSQTGKWDPVMEDIVWMTSAGTDDLRQLGYFRHGDFGGDGGGLTYQTSTDKAEYWIKRMARVTSQISGMNAVNTYTQRLAAKAALHKLIQASRDGQHVLNQRRMRTLGLSEEDINQISRELRPKSQGGKASYVLDDMSGRQLETLNLQDWDPAVRAKLADALFNWTRKVIQENDLGQLNSFLGNVVGSMFFQFRMFMIGSWTKNTLHNINMNRGQFDPTTVHMIMATSFWGGMAYMAQTSLQTVGMTESERAEFLKDRWGENNENLYAAAFQRASYASMFPMLIDNALMYPLGMDPVFDHRVTGTPSQGLTSFPALSMYDNLMRGVRGTSQAALHGDDFDESTTRALVSTMAFQNFLPVQMGINALTQDMD